MLLGALRSVIASVLFNISALRRQKTGYTFVVLLDRRPVHINHAPKRRPEIFRIGTVRYNWPMSAHSSQAFNIAHCTDSEDLPTGCTVRVRQRTDCPPTSTV